MTRRMIPMLALWVGLFGPPARAAITAFWQQVTITPEAIVNDLALANMQCWDLMTTTTGDWVGAQMGAILPGGLSFYKHPLGGLTRPDPALIGSSPALEFTTFVSAPSDDGMNNSTLILGGHPQSNPPSLGDPTSPTPGRFSLAWGNLVGDPPGAYQIARLTFPISVIPDILNGGFSDPSTTSQIDPDSSTIIPDIPEPGVLGLLGAGTLLAFRARSA